MTFTHMN